MGDYELVAQQNGWLGDQDGVRDGNILQRGLAAIVAHRGDDSTSERHLFVLTTSFYGPKPAFSPRGAAATPADIPPANAPSIPSATYGAVIRYIIRHLQPPGKWKKIDAETGKFVCLQVGICLFCLSSDFSLDL